MLKQIMHFILSMSGAEVAPVADHMHIGSFMAESLDDFNKATIHLREAVGDLKEEVSRFTI